jgi:HPt (histidine-containing phosphotransfer) domain-containing protein
MNQEAPINSAAIDRLVKLGGQKFALDMMNLFASYGGQKVGEARQARHAGNLKALAEAVHPLKSSAGNVGATRVQMLAETIETLAVSGNAEPAVAQLNELERAFVEAVAGLESERNRLTSVGPSPKI